MGQQKETVKTHYTKSALEKRVFVQMACSTRHSKAEIFVFKILKKQTIAGLTNKNLVSVCGKRKLENIVNSPQDRR